MATTLSELRTDVLLRLGDIEQSIWKEAEINGFIREGYDRFTFLTKILWKQDPLPDVASQAVYVLPSDLQFLERVTWNEERINPITQSLLAAYDATYETRETATPVAYSLDGDGVGNLRKYPAPSVNGSGVKDTTIEYYRRGADLATENTALEVADFCVKAIRHFAISLALEMEGDGQDLEMAKHYMGRFSDVVNRVVKRRRRMHARSNRSMGSRGVDRKLPGLSPNYPDLIT